MREIRLSGSEGGGTEFNDSPYPYPPFSRRGAQFFLSHLRHD